MNDIIQNLDNAIPCFDEFIQIRIPDNQLVKALEIWLEANLIGNYIWQVPRNQGATIGNCYFGKYIFFEKTEDVALFKLTFC